MVGPVSESRKAAIETNIRAVECGGDRYGSGTGRGGGKIDDVGAVVSVNVSCPVGKNNDKPLFRFKSVSVSLVEVVVATFRCLSVP